MIPNFFGGWLGSNPGDQKTEIDRLRVAAFIKQQNYRVLDPRFGIKRIKLSKVGSQLSEDGTFGSYLVTTYYRGCGLITLA